VPRATDGSIVVARFHGIADSTLDSLRALFYKSAEVYLDVNGDTRIRFLPGHQRSFHFLAAPECAHDQLEGTNFRRMRLTDRDGDDAEPYEVTFFRIPFTC
jgi:hypothetical protein